MPKAERAWPTHSDLQFSEHYIIKIVQNYHFKSVHTDINSSPPNLRKLNPFKQDGLIRVGGRLTHYDLTYEQKFPILLPQKEYIVTLLVEHTHTVNLHTGSTLLFAILRNNYWILGARNLVRKVVRSCNVCFRCKPEALQPFMGNLPDYRVQPAIKAFIHTGMDMGGRTFSHYNESSPRRQKPKGVSRIVHLSINEKFVP